MIGIPWLGAALGLAFAVLGCRPAALVGPRGARPGVEDLGPDPARPAAAREVSALVPTFTARAEACFPEIFQVAFEAEMSPADRGDAFRRQRALKALGEELTGCLTGRGYGGQAVLGIPALRRWLAASDCGAFAAAAFRARRCVILQMVLEESGFPLSRPRAAPPARKGGARRFLGPPPVPADGYYRASHILVFFVGAQRAPATVTRSKMDAYRLATQVTALARAPGADFAALARRYSEGPSAPRGGDLGRFRLSQMVPSFSDAVKRLHPGEVAGPVETPFGYHVVRRN